MMYNQRSKTKQKPLDTLPVPAMKFPQHCSKWDAT
jgi:hypothetical protein